MTYLYIATLVLGGVLLASSMLLGDHDADGLDDGADSHADAAGDGLSALLFGFRSFRFWIFFSAFFGLTGLVFSGLGLVRSAVLVALISAGMGLVIGFAATWVLRRIALEETGKVPTANDYVGKSGRVLVAIAQGTTGKVRLAIGGTSVDVLAIPALDDESFAIDDEAVVIEMEGTTAKVARLQTGE